MNWGEKKRDVPLGIGVLAHKGIDEELSLLLSLVLCRKGRCAVLVTFVPRLRVEARVLWCLRTVHVDEGEVGAGVDHALSNDEPKAAGTTSDEADVAVEGKGL